MEGHPYGKGREEQAERRAEDGGRDLVVLGAAGARAAQHEQQVGEQPKSEPVDADADGVNDKHAEEYREQRDDDD